MGERKSFVPQVLPNRQKLDQLISTQITHQRDIRKHTTYVLNSRMTPFEAFRAFENTDTFDIFYRTVHSKYYCPASEWKAFYTTIRGRFAELMAEDILVGKTHGGKQTLLDANHSRPIIEALFPGTSAREYGFGNTSLNYNGLTLPSPDFMLFNRNRIVYLFETSCGHETPKPRNCHYWNFKKSSNRRFIEAYRKIPGFRDMFQGTRPHFVMSRVAFENRKELIPNQWGIEFSRLPFTFMELDSYFSQTILSSSPPESICTKPKDSETTHWRELLDTASLEVHPILTAAV